MKQALTHAGCVVFRNEGAKTLFLIISSSSGEHWVLPKGHIDAGESPESAALRELREEAGLKGQILEPLLIQNFKKHKEGVTIQYFLVQMVGVQPSHEDRIFRWESEEAAMKLLSFGEAKSALQAALTTLGRH